MYKCCINTTVLVSHTLKCGIKTTLYYLGIWLMRMVLNTIQSNQSLSILYPRNNHIITLYNIIAKAIQSQQPLLTISPTPL